jgi:peptidoglycan/xylan/chitin deacetylase (PgdA/CDA1 family)
VDRRRFLSLAGAFGAGAAGGAVAVQRVAPGPATEEPPRAVEVSEQPDRPNRGTHRVLWAIETDEPLAALTFDDGPDPEFTSDILDVLDRYDVQATFFMMGWNASNHGDLARAVVDAGHEIGNHTYEHQNLAFASGEETFEQIHRGSEVIEEVTGIRPRWFRPPRGQLSGFSIRHAAMLGLDSVIWSVTRGVPGAGIPEEVRDHLVRQVGPGDIVDLHDGLGRGTFNPGRKFTEDLRVRRQVEVEALPGAIEQLLEGGIRFATISDLVAAERPDASAP